MVILLVFRMFCEESLVHLLIELFVKKIDGYPGLSPTEPGTCTVVL